MNKTILFDLDGTLIDSTPAILFGFKEAFKFFGKIPPPDSQITTLIGHTLYDIFTSLGVYENVDEYIKIYKENYKRVYLDKTSLLHNAFEALSEASKIADVGIVTTKTTQYSIDILHNLGVMKFIKTVVGADDVGNPKPSPEPVLLALKRLNKGHENAFMVGDTKLDLIAAKSANVVGVGLLCGYGSAKSLKEHSEFVFDNACEAVKFIAQS